MALLSPATRHGDGERCRGLFAPELAEAEPGPVLKRLDGPALLHRRGVAIASGAALRSAALDRLYRPGFSGHKILLCDRPYWGECGEPFAPGLSRAAVGILLQQPVLVIARDEGPDRGANLLGIAEDPAPHDLLLEGADEPLRHTVGLGLA